jgi:uncharacterized protein YdhG (YjbR/CyaY superfamily)
MTGHSQAVSAYIEQAPEKHRWMMLKLRELVHEVHPDIAEDIAYRMPVFKRGETMLMGMASRSRYLAMYFDPEAVGRFRDALGDVDSGKGCVRVTRPEKLPIDAVRGILESARSGLCGH